MLVTFGLVAVVPAILEALPLGIVGTVLAQVVRWVLLLAVFAGALAVLYRVAPDRDAPSCSWVSLGAVIVTVVWAVVSVGFSVYVDNFGSYDKTYGAIAGVIVLMLWLYLTCYLVLLGAEINAEAEHQTAHDTTTGEPQPMGDRDAKMADTLPENPEPTKADSDPTRQTASAHVRLDERRPDDLDRLRAATDVDGDLVALRHPGRGVDQRQRDPGPQGGRERAAGDLADRGAGGVEHGHAGTRDAPAGGPQPPQQAARAGLLLGERAPRGPRTPASSSRRPSRPGLLRRDVRDSSWPCSG